MICNKCHNKACQPIGATLRGVQLVACPSCGQVYTPDLIKLPVGMPAVNIMRGGAVVARRSHKPKVGGSSPSPATKKKTNQSTKNHKTVVKKRKIKAGKHA